MTRKARLPAMPVLLALSACATGQTLTTTALPPDGRTLQGVPYFLPRAYVPVTFTGMVPKADAGTAARFQVSVEPGTPVLIGDSSARLFLAYNHSRFSYDQFDLKVDQNGLLQSSSAQAADQTAAIASKVVEIIGEIAQLASGGVGGGFRASALIAPRAVAPPRAGCTLAPFTRIVTYIPGDPDPEPVRLGRRGGQEVTVSVRRVAEPPRPVMQLPLPDRLTSGGQPVMQQGVAFRLPTVQRLTIAVEPSEQAATACGLASYARDIYVTVPDIRPEAIIWQDTSRSPLISRQVKLGITNGMLTGVQVDNPSEVLAAVSLPADLLKALIAIPASVLTFKVQQIGAAQGLTEAQTKAIQAQIALLKAQADLQAAREGR